MSKIVNFYVSEGTDYEGRTLKDVHALSFNQLEDLHDYIQWIFPLNEESRAVPWSPILTEEDIRGIQTAPGVHYNLYKSFVLMCNFYGFDVKVLDCNSVKVNVELDSAKFGLAANNWITPYNHNYLRLTRILKSLRLLGCEDWATELFNVLQVVYERYAKVIGARTYTFWCDAVHDELPMWWNWYTR